MTDPPALGIDLGTTNSVVAVMDGEQPETVLNSEGDRLTPSVVSILDVGERLVGVEAANQAVQNPGATVESVKRRMGEEVTFELHQDAYRPEEISAMILRKLRQDAAAYLGAEAQHAVITVPAYFSENQRQATKDAGSIAGFDDVAILSEPVAAAVAYGLHDEDVRTVAVVDLGGGTFDVSLIEQGPANDFHVEATAGDTDLGGDDWDSEIADWVLSQLNSDHMVDVKDAPQAAQRLEEAVEEAKQRLSAQSETTINIPFFVQANEQPVHVDETLSRDRFEEITGPLFDRLERPIEDVLNEAGMSQAALDDVILVGGATRMPAVKQRVENILNQEPSRVLHPDEVVAHGAAIRAADLTGSQSDTLVQDVTPFDLGVETRHGQFEPVISRNTTVPTVETKTFATSEANQTRVRLSIYQGNRPVAHENRRLGDCVVSGLPPMPPGAIAFDVSFELQRDGTLDVSVDGPTGPIHEDIQIDDVSGLSDEEIERMRLEAEQHALQDQLQARVAEEKTRAEQLLSFVDRNLPPDHLSDSEQAVLEKARVDLEDAFNRADSPDEIKECREELERAIPRRHLGHSSDDTRTE
jgi:molecular chaperone DnaK